MSSGFSRTQRPFWPPPEAGEGIQQRLTPRSDRGCATGRQRLVAAPVLSFARAKLRTEPR